MRKRFARIARHIKQQIELGRCQVQAVAADGHCMRPGIDDKVPNLNRRIDQPLRRRRHGLEREPATPEY